MKKHITHHTNSFAFTKQATHPNGNRFFLKHLLILPIFLMALLWSDLGWGQVSYLGLDGGFEGSATIDNTNLYSGAQSGKWSKNNAETTIANETTNIRSGSKAISFVGSTTTGRRVFSPLQAVSTTDRLVIQYYIKTTNGTNSTEVQCGFMRNTTEQLNGAYTKPTTWTKVTYAPTGVTNTNNLLWGILMARKAGTGGTAYIDDVCIYTGTAADVTAPNAPTSAVVNGATASSLNVSWTAASGGVDGGGYLVVRGTSDPTTAPNANGIYAVGNTVATGMTVVYQGTGTSFTDNGLAAGTTYYYRIYTYDKAYNYSGALTGNGTTTSSTPTLSVGALTGFGNVCTGTTSSPNSFTISGTLLTAANVTVDALSGYTYSTTSGGTYTSSLSLSQPGGTYSQEIFVKFSPVSVQSYDGNIAIGGGGATSVNRSVTGSGINTAPSISAPTSASVTTTTASLGGNITAIGCNSVTERGIYWSTTDGFADGAGTKVSETGTYSTGTFTVAVSGLTANTIYYYKAFATNSGGTVYTTQGTFTTLKIEPTNQATVFACGTTTSATIPLTWAAAAAGSQAPDGYLIKWSSIGYGSIAAPSDGTAESTTSATTSYTATGLTPNTTYYFKIWSYTNSGTGINYNLTSPPTTSCATIDGPCLSENFSGFTAGTHASPNSTNVEGSLDTYTQTTGWTGTAIYQAGGEIKLGSSSARGSIITPTVSLSSGASISFDLQEYDDAILVQVFHASDGVTFTQVGSDITAPNNYTTQTLSISGGTSSSKIKIAAKNSSNSRFYLDNIAVTCFSAGPLINVSASSLTGFNYNYGSGPSAEQSFTVSGTNLTNDISIAPPTDYEISTGTGGSFSATNPITLTQSGGTVSATTIYVRLKSGLNISNCTYSYNNENITASSTGASSQTVACSGTVTSTSCIYEGFESGSTPTGWAQSGTYINTTAPYTCSYMVGMNDVNDYIKTKSVTDPKALTFWCKASSATSNFTVKVQTSTDGTTWSDYTSFAATGANGGDVTTTYSQKTVNFCLTGTYYIRWLFFADASGSFYMDDVEVTCGACATKPEPDNQPTSFACGSSTASAITLTWAGATGTDLPDGYLVKWSTTSYSDIANPVDNTPESNGGTAYNIPYGTNTYTPSGLSSGTTYYFKIWSYSNSGSNINYLTATAAPQSSCTTLEGACLEESFESTTYPPTASGTWTNNGTVQGTSGACTGSKQVIFNGTGDYLISPELAYPSQLTFKYKRSGDATAWSLKVQYSTTLGGTYTDIATISNPTATCQTASIDLGVCSAEPVVYLKFLDARASGANERYIDDVQVFCTTGTCSTPTTHAATLTFTAVGSSSMTLNFNTGDGARRMIVAKEGSAVTFAPTSGTSYNANSDFSSAADQGSGNKIVYKGTGSSAFITGLTPGTTYYFTIYEYNCSNGMEQYYTTGSPLSGNQTTLPGPVTNLVVGCQTGSTADISWTLPEGNYDGVIIGVRQGSAAENITGDASSYTANANVTLGTLIGTATRTVYKGTGTTVTVTNLTTAPYYITAYTYKGATGTAWSSTTENPTASITTLGIPNVTSLTTSPGNAQAQVSWINPTGSCWDEVMVVGKVTSAVSAAPTGDGSSYTANSVWTSGTAFDGGYVVFRGTGNSVTITGLTNGTSYCFKVFTRSGTTWSAGTYECVTPIAGITTFVPGDIAVFGVNSNTSACIGSQAGDDEISFVCFKDFTTGTTLDMTDNGWEKCSTGKWGNVEGYLRIKRTGSTITAGTILTFRLNQATGTAAITGMYPDNNWSIEIEEGSLIFNTNGDQIFFMQGGTWNNGTVGMNNATYTGGAILFAFNTNNTWTSGICSTANNSAGEGRSQNSGLLLGMECFNMIPMVATDYLEYAGDMSAKSQRDWITYLKDGDNWNAYSGGCSEYESMGYDYLNTDHTISITADASFSPGLWNGSANTNWFECQNWGNLRVPDKTVDVSIPSTGVSNDCTIGAPNLTGQPSEGYTEASCKNLTNSLSGYAFNINHADSKLDIWGNYNTNATFNHTLGLVTFKGTTAQTHTGVATFYNLTLNNASGLTLYNNISITGTLTTTNGILTTQVANTIDLGSGGTIIEGASTFAPTSYVTGNVKATRNIGGAYSPQSFGGIGLDITQSGADNLTVVTRTTGTSILVGTTGASILRYFDITPTEPNSGFNATMVFHYFDHEIASFLPEADLEMWKSEPDGYIPWYVQTAAITEATNISTKTGIPSFSRWTLAPKNKPLPVELLSFEAACNDGKVDFAWSTASEVNNDYFTVEKSYDSKTWEFVISVMGSGNSNIVSSYFATDDSYNSQSAYYRLKQSDYNGGTTVYNPVFVKCSNVNREINLYPNPATDEAICSVYSNIPGKTTIEITNYMGSIIFSSNFDLQKGFNTMTLDVSGYPSGSYYVVIHASDGSVFGYKQLIIK